MNNGEAIIQTAGLTKYFGESCAVDDLQLEIQRGEVFGFLGHNGAGKTTTVRLLNGALAPSTGKARVLGKDPQLEGPALRQRTGVLTENPSLEERLTGYENLKIYAALYDVAHERVDDRVHELLEQFDILGAGNDYVNTYSKGMKQRLALARALIHDPELLFLDEPTSGLDPVAARNVHSLIQRMTASSEHTVFLCTHNLTEAQNLCDRVAVLEHGRVLAQGSPAELAEKFATRAQFELEVSPATMEAAISVVSQLAGIHHRRIAENRLQLSGAAHHAVPDLIKRLALAGVDIFKVQPDEATLEDVYFALHRGNNQEQQA